MSIVQQSFFPKDRFECYFERNTHAPLVVSPLVEMDIIDWAKQNQQTVARAINEYGAVVFSGFKITKENFTEAFTAITGMPPQIYKGNSPRDEVSAQVYKSTAVSNAHIIPLHQEVSDGARKHMPKYISFFCVTPPEKGTGQTLVGNAREVSKRIQILMPHLWRSLATKSLTYTARYLPQNNWRTKWIRWLNPSHATIQKKFGTENKKEVEEKCRQEGLICEWDGAWAVVSHKGVPGIITADGESVFCNQVHLNRLNSQLCGGWFYYIFARILLYPTSRSMQYDVQFDDGSQIKRSEAGTLLTIIQEHQQGRSWKKGDLMVLDNATTLHAKTRHVGQREIIVAMSGSVTQNT